MPAVSGSFCTSSFAEVLRKLVKTRQSGYLKIREGDQEGFLAIENGIIINARSGSCVALQALFQFVGWQTAGFDFHERPLPDDLSRDLAVYDPQVLIEGIAFKEQELAILQEAIPSLDSVLFYVGDEALGAVEATPADLGLLSLANGHRSVLEIAEKVMLSPIEVARSFARFRKAGVLELVTPKISRSNSKMAEAG